MYASCRLFWGSFSVFSFPWEGWGMGHFHSTRSPPTMTSKSSLIPFFLLFLIVCFYTISIPYTKVEESFTIQSIHDFIFLSASHHQNASLVSSSGTNTKNHVHIPRSTPLLQTWDHLTFQGVVPRSCIPSAIMASFFHLYRIISEKVWQMFLMAGMPCRRRSHYTSEISAESAGNVIHGMICGIFQPGVEWFDASAEAAELAPNAHHNHYHIALILSRLLIGAFSLLSLWFFIQSYRYSTTATSKQQPQKQSSHTTNRIILWCLLTTATQFHFLYYSSRPLPNIMALSWTLLAQSFWLRRQFKKCFFVMGFAAVLLRGELFALVAPMALIAVVLGWVNLFVGALVGTLGMSLGVMLSVVVDSWFWQRLLWPEGEVLFYNTFMNKSKEWGMMAWHWYFSSALPRALLGAYPMMLLGVVLLLFRRRVERVADCTATKQSPTAPLVALGAANLIFIALYSLLPHKELRFIFYSIPCLNLLSAYGMDCIWTGGFTFWRKQRSSTFILLVGKLLVLLLLLASLFATVVFYSASSFNYYGAEALLKLQRMEANSSLPKLVHMDGHTTMNGVNRFLHHNSTKWLYSKEEHHPDYSLYSHLLTGEDPKRFEPDFEVIGHQNGFAGISVRNMTLRMEPRIHILRRRGFNTINGEVLQRELDEFFASTPAGEDLSQCRQPNLKWAQKNNKITINAQIYGAHNVQKLLNPAGLRLYTEDARGNQYCISMDFFSLIDEAASEIKIQKSKIRMTLSKMYTMSGKMWPRLLKQKKVPSFLKINWEEWNLEEDEIEIEEVFSTHQGEKQDNNNKMERVGLNNLHESQQFSALLMKKLGVNRDWEENAIEWMNQHFTPERVSIGSLLFAVMLVLLLVGN